MLNGGRRGNRLKALWWDRTGYCVLYKRLERGVFRFPTAMLPGDTSVSIEAAEFAKILEGLDLVRATKGIGITHRKGAAAEESSPTT
jgi:transposase